MVTYNPKDWYKLIVQFHKSDTFRILLPPIFLLGFITAAVTFLEKTFLKTYAPTNLTIFHQISGFIISLVLVFRINSAYDRWWEGRKLWGSLLNNSRNLAIKLHALIPENDTQQRAEIAAAIANFAYVLKEHLRSKTDLPLSEKSAMNEMHYRASSHKPNFIAKYLNNYILNNCLTHSKTQNDYLIVSENLDDFTEICGACERIKNTPIPYSYSIFIKKIVFFYVITMPLTFGLTIGYWAIPLVMLMFYAFASLELISEEIEDPFGLDENDLPTDDIALKIKDNVTEILLTN
jgi:ion channel-forming bestrophin family protein